MPARQPGRRGEIVDHPLNLAEQDIVTKVLQFVADRDSNQSQLAYADIVVAGGLGLRSAENFELVKALAGVLGAERDRVRVLSGNVGGSFGMKASVYPEYIAILHAARQLGRPVKWTDARSESFLSDSHGRDHDRGTNPGYKVDMDFMMALTAALLER